MTINTRLLPLTVHGEATAIYLGLVRYPLKILPDLLIGSLSPGHRGTPYGSDGIEYKSSFAIEIDTKSDRIFNQRCCQTFARRMKEAGVEVAELTLAEFLYDM